MIELKDWATRWDISAEAYSDLMRIFTAPNNPTNIRENIDLSEANIQAKLRVEAAKFNCRLWRNNVGAARDVNGRYVRYGLCNDSAQLNSHIKSSDLIGIRPILVTSAHVGLQFGQFVSREVKRSGWEYNGTEREKAQLRWIQLITALGGDARFSTGELNFE